MLAANSSTKAELDNTQRKLKDGSNPVEIERQPYRPKLESTYVEPEDVPDAMDGFEFLHQHLGNVLYHHAGPLPPRNDIVVYNDELHKQELEASIQWMDCPPEH